VPIDFSAHSEKALAYAVPFAEQFGAKHGRTGLKYVFLGSVAEEVVRHAPCPVLVVCEQEHEFLAT
jgi:nucleotide-binding universal stress UspA family protein